MVSSNPASTSSATPVIQRASSLARNTSRSSAPGARSDRECVYTAAPATRRRALPESCASRGPRTGYHGPAGGTLLSVYPPRRHGKGDPDRDSSRYLPASSSSSSSASLSLLRVLT